MSEYCSILGDDYVETYLGCTICYTTRIVGGAYYSNCVEVYHHDILDAKKDICEQQDGVWDGATCDLEITPYWKYNSTYRGIDIEVWYPIGTPYRAYFDGAWHEESTRPLLKAAIDAFLGPVVKKPTSLSLTASPASGAPPFYTTLTATLKSNVTPVGYKEVEIYMRHAGIPWTKLTWGDTNFSGVASFYIHIGVVPVEFYAHFTGDSEYEDCVSPTITITAEGEVFTSIMDFVVPDYLPAGSSVSVSVLAKNTGGAAGRLNVYIDGNSRDPDEQDTVGTGSAMSIQPGASVWLDITCFNMPEWDYLLTARNYDFTSQISKTITLGEAPVGIPTTTTLSAPKKIGVNEKFNISGILYETESGIPILGQPINHSYNGKSLGGSTTGVDGDYLKEVSIPKSNVWTIKSEFPGTPGYAASRSVADTMVAASPLEAAVAIAGSVAVGLALIMYSLS